MILRIRVTDFFCKKDQVFCKLSLSFSGVESVEAIVSNTKGRCVHVSELKTGKQPCSSVGHVKWWAGFRLVL